MPNKSFGSSNIAFILGVGENMCLEHPENVFQALEAARFYGYILESRPYENAVM